MGYDRICFLIDKWIIDSLENRYGLYRHCLPSWSRNLSMSYFPNSMASSALRKETKSVHWLVGLTVAGKYICWRTLHRYFLKRGRRMKGNGREKIFFLFYWPLRDEFNCITLLVNASKIFWPSARIRNLRTDPIYWSESCAELVNFFYTYTF